MTEPIRQKNPLSNKKKSNSRQILCKNERAQKSPKRLICFLSEAIFTRKCNATKIEEKKIKMNKSAFLRQQGK